MKIISELDHYKNKVNFYSKLDKFDDYYRLCLLILGIVAILIVIKLLINHITIKFI